MKKVISLIAVLVLSVVALSACSKEQTKTYRETLMVRMSLRH